MYPHVLIAVFLGLSLASGVRSQTATNVEAIAPVKTVFCQSLDWSPDSRTIYFCAVVLENGKYESGKWEIYSVNVDGGQLSKLTQNVFDDLWPSFSPDGKSIAFESKRDGMPKIYVMNADGKDAKRITADSVREMSPAWSPDGKTLAFISDVDGNKELYSMEVSGTNRRRLTTTDCKEYNPAWSPDGKQIIYYCEKGDNRDQVFVFDLQSGISKNITNDTSNNIFPAFSSDGKQAIFSSTTGDHHAVFALNIDGTGNRNVLMEGAGFFSRYSRDGKYFAVIAGPWPDSWIEVVASDGSSRKKVTDKQAIVNLNK